MTSITYGCILFLKYMTTGQNPGTLHPKLAGWMNAYPNLPNMGIVWNRRFWPIHTCQKLTNSRFATNTMTSTTHMTIPSDGKLMNMVATRRLEFDPPFLKAVYVCRVRHFFQWQMAPVGHQQPGSIACMQYQNDERGHANKHWTLTRTEMGNLSWANHLTAGRWYLQCPNRKCAKIFFPIEQE